VVVVEEEAVVAVAVVEEVVVAVAVEEEEVVVAAAAAEHRRRTFPAWRSTPRQIRLQQQFRLTQSSLAESPSKTKMSGMHLQRPRFQRAPPGCCKRRLDID
jgi:hypothetical protein